MAALKIVSRISTFLPAELRRVRESLRKATGQLAATPVHDARKSIKKLRAVLRLADTMVDRPLLDRVAVPLRQAAHQLGPLRDHVVLRKVTRALRKRAEPEPEPPTSPDAGPLLRMAEMHLRHASIGLHRLLKAGLNEDEDATGLRRLYRRARRARWQAKKTRSDADLHAWRRRAKDLLYALDVIGTAPRWRAKLRKLTEFLGDDHDLASFAQHYGSDAVRHAPRTLLKRAKKRRAPLQKKAFRLGRRLFDDRPRAFIRRMTA